RDRARDSAQSGGVPGPSAVRSNRTIVMRLSTSAKAKRSVQLTPTAASNWIPGTDGSVHENPSDRRTRIKLLLVALLAAIPQPTLHVVTPKWVAGRDRRRRGFRAV